MHREAHHELEGNDALALLEDCNPLGPLEEGEDDAAYLSGHGAPQLGLVHDAGLDEGLAESSFPFAHERLGADEFLVRDAAQRHEGLSQAVFLEIARREHDASMVEEESLDQLALAGLQVAAPALGRQGSHGLGQGLAGKVREHGVLVARPRKVTAPAGLLKRA